MTLVLVTGASGQLGGYLLRELTRYNDEVSAWSGTRTGELFGRVLQRVDLTDAEAVKLAFQEIRPNAVIHAAALARINECYDHPTRAQQVNVTSSALLAQLAATSKCRFVYVSTDLVFDGSSGNYSEQDIPAPISIYGRSKAAAEQAVLAVGPALVVRVSLLFGPSIVGRKTFFDEQLDALRRQQAISLFEDEWRTPLSLETAARALAKLARSHLTGILHLGGPERMSRLEMGQHLARFLGVDSSVIRATRRDQAPSAEPRPKDVSLDSTRWREEFPNEPWPKWDEALAELMAPGGQRP